MSQIAATRQYDETAGNVPVSDSYRQAIEMNRIAETAEQIAGRIVSDEEAIEIVAGAGFTTSYLAANYPMIFGWMAE